MSPGQYDKRMTLMQPARLPASATGEQEQVGIPIASMWCGLRPLAGRELTVASQRQSEATHTIHTWYRTDLTIDTAMWFVLGSRRFDIVSIENVEELNREWLLHVVEHHGK